MAARSYADTCLERAENFPFHSSHYGHDTIATSQAAEHELDDVYSTMVPELCRRLKRACEVLREVDYDEPDNYYNVIADELEAPLSQKENK